MAVSFAVSNLVRDVVGSRRRHQATLTCTGTTTDDGDAIAPSALGLSVIEDLQPAMSTDSASNPENSFVIRWNKSTGKIIFYSQAAAGATTPLAQITDATSVSNYIIEVQAWGR